MNSIRLKEIVIAAVGLLVLAAAVVGFIKCRSTPPAVSASQDYVPPGWNLTAVQKTPLLGKNKASEYTGEFPAGSKVVVIETPKGEIVKVGILPGGQVVVPKGTKAVTYEKRPPLFAFEARPFVAGGLGVGGLYGAGGVDIIRLWKFHAGPAVAVSYWPGDENPEVGIVGKTSLNVWRNVDLAVMAGYGTEGEMAAGGIEIAIQ